VRVRGDMLAELARLVAGVLLEHGSRDDLGDVAIRAPL